MLREYVIKRLALVTVLLLVPLVASACYKDAGDDLQPTSRQVNLTDIAPTFTPAPPTATATPPPTDSPQETATRTLVPTTTPADFATAPPSAVPTETPDESLAAESMVSDATPTQFMLNSTSPNLTPSPTVILITTPGMSDIMASATPMPTIDPSFQPTPTAIPVEENPCIHIVKPNDTLYSIAQDNSVLLSDLVAENPEFLGGSAATPLQIGWQLRVPGCQIEDQAAVDATPQGAEGEPAVAATVQPAEGGQIVHVVQAGEGIFSIARKYGIEPQAIIEANNLINPNLIYPGDELIIPASP